MSAILSVAAAFALLACATVQADETDQFMAWGVELQDSAPALNDFIAQTINARLRIENDNAAEPCGCAELTERIFRDIYLDRFRGPLLVFAESSEMADVYPPRDVSDDDFAAKSIYRNAPFYSIIRLTRTIRVGEVYLGIDKLAHVFGIGRRYYVNFLSDRANGVDASTAEKDAVLWGALTENTILGRTVNGIFSHADLEANAQGLRLAREFCDGNDPCVENVDGKWHVRRAVDLRDYVTPAFDESFNISYYSDALLAVILPILSAEYVEKAQRADLIARFERYRESAAPSHSTELVEEYLREHGVESQRARNFEALKMSPELIESGDAETPNRESESQVPLQRGT